MDNLPIPQSRIEELMNAFISRDSSQISTPQSRIEEFWYHLIEGTNALPIPQSRIELLLKKIIENDTKQIPLAKSRAEEFLVSILTGDINKLPIPQSRSEYYLDYIARNNLVLDDIEYVKYSDTNITASNTVQKPFRSAILSGCTSFDVSNYEFLSNKYLNVNDGTFISGSVTHKYVEDYFTIPKGTQVITLKGNNNYKKICYYDNSKQFISGHQSQSAGVNDFTTDVPTGASYFRFNTSLTTTAGVTIDEYLHIYLDGFLYLTNKEGYTEGARLISCKMPVLTTTGKNLFDITKHNLSKDSDGDYICTNYHANATPVKYNLKPNTKYKVNNLEGTGHYNLSINGVWVNTNDLGNVSFTTDNSGEYYIRVGSDTYNNRNKKFATHLQIEEGSTITPYEPHKSNILTVNEDVTLRSNGNVYDELDLLTGKLTQRIDEDGEVLAKEVIKTVGLKVVDQDGNPVKQLSAFDETTHIVSSSASDNSLIAIAEVEVPTKLIEALNDVKSLSSDVEILINEVDNAQKLQDENSTIVMSAMTELYEIALTLGGDS